MFGDLGVPRRGGLLDLGLHNAEGNPLVDPVLIPPYAYLWWIAGLFSSERVDEALAIGAEANLTILSGLPSRLMAFARLCAEREVTVRPEIVLSSFEQLMETSRAEIRAAYGCPVTCYYGTAEVGIVAWECAAGRYHFDDDFVVLEVVDAEGRAARPGGSGRLVLTSLKSLVMPMIRYDTGDLARLPEGVGCACGSPLRSIAGLEGRAAVTLLTASGLERVAYTLLSMVDGLGATDYQVVQSEAGQIRIIVQPGISIDAERLARLRSGVREWLHEDLGIQVSDAGDFQLSPSGKRNPFVRVLPPASHSELTFDSQRGAV